MNHGCFVSSGTVLYWYIQLYLNNFDGDRLNTFDMLVDLIRVAPRNT